MNIANQLLLNVKTFINYFVPDIIFALNNCEWISVGKEQKTKLENQLFEFITKKLMDENIIFGNKGNSNELISKTKIDKIVLGLIQLVNQNITVDCLETNWKKDYIPLIKNNLYNIMNGNKNYSSIQRKINAQSNSKYISTTTFGKFKF